jgi:hypothetical protein
MAKRNATKEIHDNLPSATRHGQIAWSLQQASTSPHELRKAKGDHHMQNTQASATRAEKVKSKYKEGLQHDMMQEILRIEQCRADVPIIIIYFAHLQGEPKPESHLMGTPPLEPGIFTRPRHYSPG